MFRTVESLKIFSLINIRDSRNLERYNLPLFIPAQKSCQRKYPKIILDEI